MHYNILEYPTNRLYNILMYTIIHYNIRTSPPLRSDACSSSRRQEPLFHAADYGFRA